MGGSSEYGVLCDCVGSMPRKVALRELESSVLKGFSAQWARKKAYTMMIWGDKQYVLGREWEHYESKDSCRPHTGFIISFV